MGKKQKKYLKTRSENKYIRDYRILTNRGKGVEEKPAVNAESSKLKKKKNMNDEIGQECACGDTVDAMICKFIRRVRIDNNTSVGQSIMKKLQSQKFHSLAV